MKSRRSQVTAGFSLIEATLAVGIMGFAFVAIIGSMPLGLTSFRATKNASTASQISQQVFSDVQATAWAELTGTQLTSNPASGTPAPNSTVMAGAVSGTSTLRLPAPSGPATAAAAPPVFTRYFNDQGTEVTSMDSTGIYQTNVCVLCGTPWVQPVATGTTVNGDLATVLIQVAYVPGHQAPDLGTTAANTNVWTGTAAQGAVAIQIFSFDTCVARNF